jgi:hypothetical protein
LPHTVTQYGFTGAGTCNDVLNFKFNTGADTKYVRLYTVAPTATGGGTEVSGTGYAAVSFTRNTTSFPAASGGSIANGIAFDFGTAGSDWAPSATPVVGAVIANTSSGALGSTDIIHYFEFDTPRVILNGDPAKFPIGSLIATEV